MPGWPRIPPGLFVTNQNHFQLAMLAYNLNAWLMLFNREATDTTESLKHTTLATARLRFLFIAAKIWRHSGRTGVSFSEHYEEERVFRRLMERLQAIKPRGDSFVPVVEGTRVNTKSQTHPFSCIIFYAPIGSTK